MSRLMLKPSAELFMKVSVGLSPKVLYKESLNHAKVWVSIPWCSLAHNLQNYKVLFCRKYRKRKTPTGKPQKRRKQGIGKEAEIITKLRLCHADCCFSGMTKEEFIRINLKENTVNLVYSFFFFSFFVTPYPTFEKLQRRWGAHSHHTTFCVMKRAGFYPPQKHPTHLYVCRCSPWTPMQDILFIAKAHSQIIYSTLHKVK